MKIKELLKYKFEPKPWEFLLAFILITLIFWVSASYFKLNTPLCVLIAGLTTHFTILAIRIIRGIYKKRKADNDKPAS